MYQQKEKRVLESFLSSLLVGGSLWLLSVPTYASDPVAAVERNLTTEIYTVQQKGHEITGTTGSEA